MDIDRRSETLDDDAYKHHLTGDVARRYFAQYPYMAEPLAASYPEYWIYAVAVDWRALRSIPKSKQTYEVVREAVSHDRRSFKYVSRKVLKKHPDLYEIAVRHDGLALDVVPNDQISSSLCELAVRSNAEALSLVPEKYLTDCIIDLAIAADGTTLKYVPRDRRTKARSHAALRSNVRSLESIPHEFLDEKSVLSAVSECGTLLEFVEQDYVDEEMVAAAVQNDGMALRYVPEQFVSRDLCVVAIENNPLSIQFIPGQILDEDLSLAAVSTNWEALQFVTNPSREMVASAEKQSPLALRYVPDDMKTTELCEDACARNPEAFRFVPPEIVSASMLQNWLASLFDKKGKAKKLLDVDYQILRNQEARVLSDDDVFHVLRELGICEVLSARWAASCQSFVVNAQVNCGRDWRATDNNALELSDIKIDITLCPSNLDELSSVLDGDLSFVTFADYQFEDFDPKRHELGTADVPLDVQKAIGAFDETEYRRCVICEPDEPIPVHPDSCESQSLAEHDELRSSKRLNRGLPVYYISDLHLNAKIKTRFPELATRRQVCLFIDEFVEHLVEDVPEEDRKCLLLVLGDTSFDISVDELFFSSLRRSWLGQIVCILGNHELWSRSSSGGESGIAAVDGIVAAYRIMLEHHRVRLLQNEALVVYRGRNKRLLTENELRQMDRMDLRDILLHSTYVLLGGIGYTGQSDSFNATHGIYRDTLTAREEDRLLSERFSSIHERVRQVAPEAHVIVATHTPMSDWSTADYQVGWTYLNGHTHKNYFRETNGVRVYADNQVGYAGTRASLKRFYIEGLYDPFSLIPDGIHEVSKGDYFDFNHARNIDVNYFTREGRILMLKREGVYLFMFKWDETGRLYFLSGGQIERAPEQDPTYYYDRMVEYARLVTEAFRPYMDRIERISEIVRGFGGDGKVHGSIVDIDYFTHISLDPRSGLLTFYYATSKSDRIEYGSLEKLLAEHIPRLLPRYRGLIGGSGSDSSSLTRRTFVCERPKMVRRTNDTAMYEPSCTLLQLQRLFDSGVIRLWNDEVFKSVGVLRDAPRLDAGSEVISLE